MRSSGGRGVAEAASGGEGQCMAAAVAGVRPGGGRASRGRCEEPTTLVVVARRRRASGVDATGAGRRVDALLPEHCHATSAVGCAKSASQVHFSCSTSNLVTFRLSARTAASQRHGAAPQRQDTRTGVQSGGNTQHEAVCCSHQCRCAAPCNRAASPRTPRRTERSSRLHPLPAAALTCVALV